MGEGDIVSAGGRKVAGYRDESGALHTVSTRCTPTSTAKCGGTRRAQWDCPCHGSRYSVDGDMLNSPAVEPLPPRPTS